MIYWYCLANFGIVEQMNSVAPELDFKIRKENPNNLTSAANIFSVSQKSTENRVPLIC